MKKYIGDKKFYVTMLAFIFPIMLQQLFVSLAGYVDSLMVNSYGGNALAYNGVSAANRLMFIITFVFGGIAATASIFFAQFIGAKKIEETKQSLRLSLLITIVFTFIFTIVIEVFGHNVVDMFIKNEISRAYGYKYLYYIKYSLFFIGANVCLATLFRTIGKPSVSMIAGFSGIFVNIILNYFLIFGNCGFRELGASGAAIGTLASKVMEFIILLVFIFYSKNEVFNVFKGFKISSSLYKSFIKKGIPLVANELMWSMGIVLFAKFYTYNNDDWYNAYAYSQTISDLFFVIFAGLGAATAVFIGKYLGEGNFEKAKEEFHKIKFLAVIMGVCGALLMVGLSPLIIKVFNPSKETTKLVLTILSFTALFIPIFVISSINFFTLRAGGASTSAFIVDQFPSYCVGLPIAIILGMNATKLNINVVHIYVISHFSDFVKLFMGSYFVKKGDWLVNITTQF